MLGRQIYLKLTKFTRRSRGSSELLSKFAKGLDFVRFMFQCDIDVIRRSRNCLQALELAEVREVSLYGAGHVAEIVCHWAIEIPVSIKTIYDDFGRKAFLQFTVTPVEESANSGEKLIVASLAGAEEKREHLLKLGIADERIILLG